MRSRRDRVPDVSSNIPASVQALLNYNAETGVFTWCVNRGGTARAGSRAGGIRPDGYWNIALNGQRYLAHRLAFFLMTGRWPVGVDHINGNKSDNRWCNLREADQAQNLCNTRSHRDGTSAIKGVSLNARTGKWVAQIVVRGKYTQLGYFETEVDAGEARRKAEESMQGDYRYKTADATPGCIRPLLHDAR